MATSKPMRTLNKRLLYICLSLSILTLITALIMQCIVFFHMRTYHTEIQVVWAILVFVSILMCLFMIGAALVYARKWGVITKHLIETKRVLEAENRDRLAIEKRLTHLNAVLSGIRNVNQLITKETSRERLLQGICNNLITTQGYSASWVMYYSQEGTLRMNASAGIGESFRTLVDKCTQGIWPPCIQQIQHAPSACIINRIPCAEYNCPVHEMATVGRVCLAGALRHEGRVYGTLVACLLDKEFVLDEETNLFEEVCEDIAFALYKIDLEEEREKHYEIVRENETRVRSLIDNMSDGVAIYETKDQGNTFLFVDLNKAGQRVSKVSKESIIGKSVTEVFPGIGKMGLFEIFRRVWRTGVAEMCPLSLYHDDRLSEWVENYVYKLPSGHIVAIYRDVTDIKRSEREIQERETKLTSIFRAAPIGIGMVCNRVFQEVNDRICEMTGYSRDELVGKSSRMVYPDDETYEYVGREKYHQIQEKGTGTVETKWRKKTGDSIDILLSSTPLDQTDLQKGVTFTALDITQRKATEQELRVLQNHLEDEVRRKTKELEDAHAKLVGAERLAAMGELAGTVAHEFRNQLGVIRNISYLLRMKLKDFPDPSIQKNLPILEDQIIQTDRIIENILTFARTKSPLFARVNLVLFVTKLIESTKLKYEKQGELLVDISKDLPEYGIIDELQILQVLQNLLANAFESFAKQGKVYFTVHADNQYIVFSVRDTGGGISDEVKKRMFSPLFTTKARGAGLGLAISRLLVEGHRGHIKVESAAGRGTTMTVYLPLLSSQGKDERT